MAITTYENVWNGLWPWLLFAWLPLLFCHVLSSYETYKHRRHRHRDPEAARHRDEPAPAPVPVPAPAPAPVPVPAPAPAPAPVPAPESDEPSAKDADQEAAAVVLTSPPIAPAAAPAAPAAPANAHDHDHDHGNDDIRRNKDAHDMAIKLATWSAFTFVWIFLGLAIGEILNGGIVYGVYASTWAAFAFWLLWWGMTFFSQWIPLLAHCADYTDGIFFVAYFVCLLALYGNIYRYWDTLGAMLGRVPSLSALTPAP